MAAGTRRGRRGRLVAIDPRDGRVLAMVGGESFRKSQFNLAVQGQRQTGSSFKPFVLTTAVEQGISPQTVFTSEPTVINLGDKLWSVDNYEGSYLGPIDLRGGDDPLGQLRLRAADGAGRAEERRRRWRTGSASRGRSTTTSRIGLGVEAVSPLEMARALRHARERRQARRRLACSATSRAPSSGSRTAERQTRTTRSTSRS